MKIFVSYSRHDSARVNTLQADLVVLGHEVWFDRELTGGQAWWDEILRQIRECELFVFALSPRSLESPACDREWRYAAALGKGVLPILIEGDLSVGLFPPQLAGLQYIDYREQTKQAALKLSRAVEKIGVAGPLPQPLPPPPDVPLSYLGGLRETIHTAQALSFPEQSALVIKLRHALHEERDSKEVHDLIRQFLDRDDILARVADELKQLQAEGRSGPAAADPTADRAGLAAEPSPPTPAADPAPAKSASRWFTHKFAWAAGAALLLSVLVSMCSEPTTTEPTTTAPTTNGTSSPPGAPATNPAPASPAPTSGLGSEQKKQIAKDIDQLLKETQ